MVAAQSSASRAFLIDANRLAERVEVDGRNGFRMALAYLQLKHLGPPNVRLDDGGWSRWGRKLTLPVVEGTGDHPETYGLAPRPGGRCPTRCPVGGQPLACADAEPPDPSAALSSSSTEAI